MDITITQWINGQSGSGGALDSLAIAITTFGVPLMVIIVASQWWLGVPRPAMRHAGIAAGASFLLGLGLAQIILLFVHRDRPYDAGVSHLIIAKTADWSFPSDHAIASTSIGFAWALQGLRKGLLILTGLAILICLSRIYVGMHYASDILGGLLVALFAAVAVKRVYQADTKLDRWLVSWF